MLRSCEWVILRGMSQRKYMFFTMFFLLALLVLTSVAWRDYVLTQSANGLSIFSSRF